MENDRKVIAATTGCLGLVVGATIGASLGVFAAYPLAELLSSSRESQAYLTLLVIPTVALIGAVTVSATGLGVALKNKALLMTSTIGWGLLLMVFLKGFIFSHASRPGKFRVENRTEITFENVFVGSDFRQSKRLGNIIPNETSDWIAIDLDDPTSYNTIEGRAGAGYVRYHESSVSLEDGNYTYVVTGTDSDFTYTLVKVE